jgi:hypothetical protein
LRLMKVNLLQGTSTPTLTPMPGVHNRLQRDRGPRAVLSEGERARWGRGG